jgi:hypothetical protein
MSAQKSLSPTTTVRSVRCKWSFYPRSNPYFFPDPQRYLHPKFEEVP